jgi:hypothetical protein
MLKTKESISISDWFFQQTDKASQIILNSLESFVEKHFLGEVSKLEYPFKTTSDSFVVLEMIFFELNKIIS